MIAQLISLAVIALMFLSAPIWPRRVAVVTTTTSTSTSTTTVPTTTSTSTTTLPPTTTTTLPPSNAVLIHFNGMEVAAGCSSNNDQGVDGANDPSGGEVQCLGTNADPDWPTNPLQGSEMLRMTDAADSFRVHSVVPAFWTEAYWRFRFKFAAVPANTVPLPFFRTYLGTAQQAVDFQVNNAGEVFLECGGDETDKATLNADEWYTLTAFINGNDGGQISGVFSVHDSTGAEVPLTDDSCIGASNTIFNGYQPSTNAFIDTDFFFDCIEIYDNTDAPAPPGAAIGANCNDPGVP